MRDREVCSAIARILALGTKPDAAGYVQDIISYLEPTAVERTDGQLAQDVTDLLTSHSFETPFKLLSCAMYLVSNNLLSEFQIGNLCNWMIENRYYCILDWLKWTYQQQGVLL